MSNIVINYSFPSFILQITHDGQQVLSAEFSTAKTAKGTQIADSFSCEIIRQLDEYVKDAKFNFTLPLLIKGTIHQQKTWQTLLQIKSGESLSYAKVAQLIDSGARAVGNACAKNKLVVFIPCHRVISATGGLGGFNSGHKVANLAIKRWLLKHEGVFKD